MSVKYVFNPTTATIEATDKVSFNGEVEAGTASAPSIFFTNDPNTGIYSPSSDTVAIATGGTGRLFVDGSGNIGVGIAPDARLTIQDGAGIIARTKQLAFDSYANEGIGTTYGRISDGAELMAIGVVDANKLAVASREAILFATGGAGLYGAVTERMRLDSSGHLGLGTSAPTYTLDVVGFGQQSIRVASADGDLAIVRMLSNGNNEWSLASDTVMRFRKDSTEYMRLDSSGRLGIGTGSPGTTLEVNGTISQTSQGTSSALYWAVNSGGTFYYGIDNSVGGSFGEAYAAALWHSGNRPMLFATNNSEKMRLDASGRLGLGTSTFADSNALLHVSKDNAGGTGGSVVIRNGAANTSGNAAELVFKTSAGFSSGFNSAKIAALQTTSAETADLAFYTYGSGTGTERVRITAGGLVGIGTTSPSTLLHLDTLNEATAITVAAISSTGGQLRLGIGAKSSGFQSIVATGNGLDIGTTLGAPITFFTNGTVNERARIDSSGRLLVGTSSAETWFGSRLQIQDAGSEASAYIIRNQDTANGAALFLGKSRGTTAGSATIVQADDYLGLIDFLGADGTDVRTLGARITAQVDGTPGADDLPTRLVFSVTADGASSPTEAMRIKNSRIINIANTPVYADNAAAKTGGLVDGDVYRTSTGDLKIVYT